MAGPFGAMSTADDVLRNQDLSGKRILITGKPARLGVETARALDLVERDLASLASVRACADALAPAGTGPARPSTWPSPTPASWPARRAGPPTASKPSSAPTTSAASSSSTASPACCGPARLAAVSSAGHRGADVDLDDPNFERTPTTP